MNGQRGRARNLVARALVSVATTVVAAALLAPTASASPIGDAESAMMAAWDKAGGASSPLGARKGDVYPVGDGFVLDFDGGKMFYTTDTGAKFVYGPILDKYESFGGPAGSDLGFPTVNEVRGLAGPDSRVATFSASDKPVIFWTPDHGAFVVRGAMNAAWDKLGSSGGVLGAPVGDETYDGEVTSQKFSGGEISWNRKTKEFTANPAALAGQLKDVQVAIDPAAAISMAWRAAGGGAGPLGARQGGPYPIGGDGLAQNFAGGKIYFSPATGANAVESDILAKYESLGGPVGSDLGFPTANESDGGSGPSSRIARFSGADQPVIFWTADHGAFVVRGAMRAAWDKLRGPAGKLGVPVGDQAVDGDRVSQQFTGGKVSWNRAKNTFTTDPSNLASSLSGLQIPGQNQPSTSAMPSHGKKPLWQQWWLLAGIAALVLVVFGALLAIVLRRRRRFGRETAEYDQEHDADAGYGAAVGGRWVDDDEADLAGEYLPLDDRHPEEPEPAPDTGSAARVRWTRDTESAAGPAGEEEVEPAGVYGGDHAPYESARGASLFERPAGIEEEDPDSVDTDSIPLVSEAALLEPRYREPVPEEAGHPELPEEAGHPEEGGYREGPGEAGYPEEARYPGVDEAGYPGVAQAPAGYDDAGHEDAGYDDAGYQGASYQDAGYQDAGYQDAGYDDAGYDDVTHEEAGYAGVAQEGDAGYTDAAYPLVVPHVPPGAPHLGPDGPDALTGETDAEYPDVAVPHPAPDVGYPEVATPEAHVEDTVARDVVAPSSEPRSGRHAAVDTEDSGSGDAAYTGRPTIHLPLDDPYQVPDGYPIKASARFGLYYTPESELYHDTLAEIWLSSEEVAQANGFIKAD